MKVLDLFSGLGGWSQAFKDRGHEVITVDNNPKFNPTICKDIMELSAKDFDGSKFDVILASPPCNCFSIASVYRHWDKDTHMPKDQATYESIKLVGHTIDLILQMFPRWWILENPRGMMRNVLGTPSVSTYFASWQNTLERYDCKKAFHDKRKPSLKPTDLWGRLPKMDWNRPYNWESAPRGSKSGLQGLDDRALRALIPYGLSMAVCLACEKELSCCFHGGLC